MASLNNKILLIIGLIIVLIGWVVALAGVARLNDICNTNYNDATDSSGAHKFCSDPLSYHWWGVWFTFFLAVVILILAILGTAGNWASTLQAFCAACLSVTMIDADAANGQRNAIYGYGNNGNGNGADDDVKSAVDCVLAGFIIICIGLFLVIVLLGMGSAGVNVNVNVSTSSNKTAPEKTTVTTIKTTETA